MSIFGKRDQKGGDITEVNREARGDITDINREARGDITELNPAAQGSVTERNGEKEALPGIVARGESVCGGYVIGEKLRVAAGEAELYRCEKDGKAYVAKLYRRRQSIKGGVAEKLREISCPFIARLYDVGEVRNHTVGILPYYKNGSLAGRIFTKEQIRQDILPCLNEALHTLHAHNIIHKDVKPSNIMLNDDGRTVSLIDFGISSVMADGVTIVLTRTGLTPQYAAPETFRNAFLPESDYYSLGITLFELLTGRTPYSGMTQDEIAACGILQQVPVPDDMDPEMRDLIRALTYADITNRHDREHVDRRWTYEEVKKWCEGVKLPVPGTRRDFLSPYPFGGKTYWSAKELAFALARDWEKGKKELSRGRLGGFFMSVDSAIADKCDAAQDALQDGRHDSDEVFFETLYAIDPGMRSVLWKGRAWQDMNSLGQAILDSARKKDNGMEESVSDMMAHGILSRYIRIVSPDAAEQRRVMEALEAEYRTFARSSRDDMRRKYRLGYMLAEDKTLVVDGRVFHTVDDVAEYMLELLGDPRDAFRHFAEKLLKDGELDLQFECWLRATGKSEAIDEWLKEYN